MRWIKIISGFLLHRLRAARHSAPELLKPGVQAPDFDLLDESGNRHRLEDYAGRKVILWFYLRSRTPGWTIEAARFRDRIDEFQSRNTVVLGISTDPPEENKRFKEEQRLPFPLLSDLNRDACLAYRTCAFRSAYYANRITYIIDERGIISKVYPDVDPREHASEILASL